MKRELKRLEILFESLDFKPVRGILLEGYHRHGPGRPFHDPESLVKALMLRRLDRIPREGPGRQAEEEQQARRSGAGLRWVAADRQYDSEELRRWTREALGASTAIPTYRRRRRGPRGLRVDGRFRVTGPKRAVRAYHRRLAVERVFEKMKRQLGLGGHHLRGLANVTFHVAMAFYEQLDHKPKDFWVMSLFVHLVLNSIGYNTQEEDNIRKFPYV